MTIVHWGGRGQANPGNTESLQRGESIQKTIYSLVITNMKWNKEKRKKYVWGLATEQKETVAY